MLHRLILTGLLLFCLSPAIAQDMIVTSKNDTLKVKVVDVLVDKIRFRFQNERNGQVREIHKNQVKEIIYANGNKLTIIYNRYDVPKELLLDEKTMVAKVDIAAPLLNHFTAGFEMMLKKGKNLELKASYIGPYIAEGIKYSEGVFGKAGIKFIKCRQSQKKGIRYLDPLKGSYIKPELIFSYFTQHEPEARIVYMCYAVNVLFGRQYVIKDLITLEFFGGMGCGWQDARYDRDAFEERREDDFNYSYSHLFFGRDFPLVLSGGITAGIAF